MSKEKYLEVNERIKINTASAIAWRKAFAWCSTALVAVFLYETVHAVILKYQTNKALRGLAVTDENRRTNDEFGKLVLELQKEKKQRIIAEKELKVLKKKSDIKWSK